MADVVDYLAPQADIVARLQTITGLARVYEPMDVAGLDNASQATPCAHVIYYGDAVDDTNQGGAAHVAKLTWVVVLVDKLIAGAGRRANVGELLATIITNITGYKPASAASAFARANAPSRPWFHNGYAYYPLAFTTSIRLRREL